MKSNCNILKEILTESMRLSQAKLPVSKEFVSLRESSYEALYDPRFKTYANALIHAPEIEVSSKTINQTAISVLSNSQITKDQTQALRGSLEAFCPWKKGPFNIFGVEIDAEWRSEIKWDRFLEFGMDLKDKSAVSYTHLTLPTIYSV